LLLNSANIILLKVQKAFVIIPLKPASDSALQRQNAENLKQIFPEKEYRGLSPNFYIHVSVSEL
jgi:hypothetical protein